MIIFGLGEKKIELIQLQQHKCNNCNTKSNLYVQVNKSYLHMFWIPFIPLTKKVYSICDGCEQSLTKNKMPPDLQTKAYKIKKATKTPFWYYLPIIVVTALFIVPILSSTVLNLLK